ncbi:sirohydrochlorin chelatase [Herminiimonas sp. CN]|uniref:sirohydrochlorin chelatase n=1 Tax=Herminiimonas sp. CN TaxID=1349818 RepID=UPI000473212C|nr:CbiX/SirB N-terminal domain-containing protein [Herminiimonas sp. CN]
MQKRALILFAHGARDPRWAAPFEKLRQITQQAQPEITVCNAYLEFMQPDLPAAVAQLVQAQCGDITIVPVFLGQGGHVLRDLPLLLADLRQRYPDLRLNQVDAVGEDAAVLHAIAQYCLSALAPA